MWVLEEGQGAREDASFLPTCFPAALMFIFQHPTPPMSRSTLSQTAAPSHPLQMDMQLDMQMDVCRRQTKAHRLERMSGFFFFIIVDLTYLLSAVTKSRFVFEIQSGHWAKQCLCDLNMLARALRSMSLDPEHNLKIYLSV